MLKTRSPQAASDLRGKEKARPAGKLVYICDWLPPDFGAVGQYSCLFAREYAAAGYDVVICGLTSASARETSERCGDGCLRTIYVPAPTYDRRRLLQRLLWTIRSDFRLLWASRKHLSSAETILFTGSPPFLLHFIVPLNALLRKRLIYRITDFHPECLMACYQRVPFALRWFYHYTVWLRRRVDAFQVLGEDQRRRLHAIGIDDSRIALKRDVSIVTVDPRAPPLPLPNALSGRASLLYSGNWGVAHEVDTFVEGYRRHHRNGSGRVGLWLNATGQGADEVARRLRVEGLPIARTNLVPLERLGRLLVTPDAHLITLKDAFVGYVLPSKVFGCLASGGPILYVGSAESDVHRLCSEASGDRFYRRVAVGDADGLAAALEALADSVERASLCRFTAGTRPSQR